MDRTEVAAMIGYLRSLYPQLRNDTEQEAADMISAWAELLANVNVNTAKAAVMRYAEDNPSAFPPSASQIYGIARLVKKPAPLKIPESTDAPCVYGCCDGRGFELYTKRFGHIDYEFICWCPCEYDRQLRNARIAGADDTAIDRLYRQRSYWEGRMKRLKAEAS
jgi:hypothetical protein